MCTLISANGDDSLLGFDPAKLDMGRTAPPWPGTYKIHPEERQKLTAADVVGPDGIVYPDWRYAGVPGGIPVVQIAARIEDFGGRPGDDISAALERAAAEIGAKGGGALALAAGTFYLDRPVRITADKVVIRGAGEGKTKLVFRYKAPRQGVVFFSPKPGEPINAGTWIEIHAAPEGLRKIELFSGTELIAQTGHYKEKWDGLFSLRTSGSKVFQKTGPGEHELRAVATYDDGHTEEGVLKASIAKGKGPAHVPTDIAAIMFAGAGHSGPKIALAADGKRGDTTLTLAPDHELKPGDRLDLTAPATERWNALVQNASAHGEFRKAEVIVKSVSGATVTINQPLRIDFPIIDGSFVQRIVPIRHCGVEDLTLEQPERLWTSGFAFSNAWECWVRRVGVVKAGRFPILFKPAKWCEVRDSEFNDAWFKGGGGTGYVGWDTTYDCLMENVITWELRHAPLVQWSASGNVIRSSTFHGSDAQWHSGWTNENLFENCVIESVKGNGGYGFGMWASPPEDVAHGPNGPRNVVYGCDVSSPKAGLWMGGMNEAWIILHNRFVVENGPGVIMKTASFDHIIKGNVFCLKNADAAVLMATPDCTGVELLGNTVYGTSTLVSGAAKPAREEENHVNTSYTPAPKPEPKVPSIFEWQRQKR
jgi:hypothetical protein